MPMDYTVGLAFYAFLAGLLIGLCGGLYFGLRSGVLIVEDNNEQA